MSRYRIEAGTVSGDEFTPGPFHDAVNAATIAQAVEAVRPVLAEGGFTADWGDHARVLDAERREVARVALTPEFWSH